MSSTGNHPFGYPLYARLSTVIHAKYSYMPTKTPRNAPKLYVAAYDVHWPETNEATQNAMFEFVSRNKVSGFVFGGDQFHNESVSPHVVGKKKLQVDSGDLEEHELSFDAEFLKPLERLLPKACERIWIQGNHDHWEVQYLENNFEGGSKLLRQNSLRLKDRGWKFIECGKQHRVGKLTFIHGETLRGSNHAKYAVDTYCTNLVYGHFHTLQTATKTTAKDGTDRWCAWSMPCLGNLNAYYLRNSPTAWVNGLGIIEIHDNGLFNVTQAVVTKGRFAYGGRIYRG